MRERIAMTGTGPLQDHEVLEFLLFSFVPRKNTNEMAHALMDRFGSFAGVLNADASELEKVPGMTGNAALFLSVLPEILRRYAVSVSEKRTALTGRRAVREHIAKEMFGVPTEVAGVAALDAQDGLIKFEKLARGTGDSVEISARTVAEFALRTNAVAVVIAHNHPSGNARPSQEDYDVTCRIAAVLSGMGVKLYDHIIYTDNESFSFEENGLLPESDAQDNR